MLFRVGLWVLVISSGLAVLGTGMVIVGVRFVEGVPMPIDTVVAGGAAMMLGSLVLWWGMRATRRYPLRRLPLRELLFHGIVSIGCIALLVVSVLNFPPGQRGVFLGIGFAMLTVAALMVERVLTTPSQDHECGDRD